MIDKVKGQTASKEPGTKKGLSGDSSQTDQEDKSDEEIDENQFEVNEENGTIGLMNKMMDIHGDGDFSLDASEDLFPVFPFLNLQKMIDKVKGQIASKESGTFSGDSLQTIQEDKNEGEMDEDQFEVNEENGTIGLMDIHGDSDFSLDASEDIYPMFPFLNLQKLIDKVRDQMASKEFGTNKDLSGDSAQTDQEDKNDEEIDDDQFEVNEENGTIGLMNKMMDTHGDSDFGLDASEDLFPVFPFLNLQKMIDKVKGQMASKEAGANKDFSGDSSQTDQEDKNDEEIDEDQFEVNEENGTIRLMDKMMGIHGDGDFSLDASEDLFPMFPFLNLQKMIDKIKGQIVSKEAGANKDFSGDSSQTDQEDKNDEEVDEDQFEVKEENGTIGLMNKMMDTHGDSDFGLDSSEDLFPMFPFLNLQKMIDKADETNENEEGDEEVVENVESESESQENGDESSDSQSDTEEDSSDEENVFDDTVQIHQLFPFLDPQRMLRTFQTLEQAIPKGFFSSLLSFLKSDKPSVSLDSPGFGFRKFLYDQMDSDDMNESDSNFKHEHGGNFGMGNFAQFPSFGKMELPDMKFDSLNLDFNASIPSIPQTTFDPLNIEFNASIPPIPQTTFDPFFPNVSVPSFQQPSFDPFFNNVTMPSIKKPDFDPFFNMDPFTNFENVPSPTFQPFTEFSSFDAFGDNDLGLSSEEHSGVKRSTTYSSKSLMPENELLDDDEEYDTLDEPPTTESTYDTTKIATRILQAFTDAPSFDVFRRDNLGLSSKEHSGVKRSTTYSSNTLTHQNMLAADEEEYDSLKEPPTTERNYDTTNMESHIFKEPPTTERNYDTTNMESHIFKEPPTTERNYDTTNMASHILQALHDFKKGDHSTQKPLLTKPLDLSEIDLNILPPLTLDYNDYNAKDLPTERNKIIKHNKNIRSITSKRYNLFDYAEPIETDNVENYVTEPLSIEKDESLRFYEDRSNYYAPMAVTYETYLTDHHMNMSKRKKRIAKAITESPNYIGSIETPPLRRSSAKVSAVNSELKRLKQLQLMDNMNRKIQRLFTTNKRLVSNKRDKKHVYL